MEPERPSKAQFEPHSEYIVEPSRGAFILDLIKFTILALVIVAPIRLFIAQPFIVNGSSMDPTFHDGDYLIVDELSYLLDDPKRGDVVIFKYPKDRKLYFIKRVIGLPGESITIRGGRVSITREGADSFELTEPYLVFAATSESSITLGPRQYFVMGDNRPASSDSRIWGPVERNLIAGKVFLRLFPFSAIAVRPGSITSK